MARVELPESRLRARRKRRRARLALICAGGVLLFAAALVALSYAPFLEVSAVEVAGAQTVATSTIESYVRGQMVGRYLFIFPKRNIFLYPKHDIAAGLLVQYPALKAADVHAKNFHTITAAVVEREPKALWCGTGPSVGRCLYTDESGIAYAPAAGDASAYVDYLGPVGDTPVSDTALQYLSGEPFRALTALVDALSQKDPANPVRVVTADAQGDVEARFDDGFVLKFALNDAGGDVFERFGLALQSDPFKAHKLFDFEYLDLRFGDKLYYKLK
jgi:cell division septal protein FtsQ